MNPETLTDKITKFVRDIGFPAAVAFFVLWRLEGAMQANTAAIADLRTAVLRAVETEKK